MGLRFRKSVTLCKGVKLNFGKSGASVSFGGKGYRKTINTKGQVTTTVGLPGTGLYYTDTKPLKANRSDRGSNVDRNAEPEHRSAVENNKQDYLLGEAVETYFTPSSDADTTQQLNKSVNHVQKVEAPNSVAYRNSGIAMEDIRKIYLNCDATVDWTEILVSSSAEEMFMEDDVWAFYKDVANKVLSGDIDTYLHVIEQIRPLDDLLAYGGDFEFGTDNPAVMEVEFRVMPEDVLGKEYSAELFDEYISACSIRVARDIMALLPVMKVRVRTMLGNNKVLDVEFDKGMLSEMNYIGNLAKRIVSIAQRNNL